jgi:peptidoglycan/xylan/chitin deacetylase (PgdA/CDA1 family)
MFNKEKKTETAHDPSEHHVGFSSVGVDVDQLVHYYRIHGLTPPENMRNENAAWEIAIPRFMDLFDEVGIKGTFYCVGADVEKSEVNQKLLKEMVARGHEIGNHSWHHFYDLTDLDEATQIAEVQRSKEILEHYSGTQVLGFRAPGYHSSGYLSTAAKNSGHLYESSAFPCSSYYLAKALVMGIMKLKGQNSKAILGSPSILLAPRSLYAAKIDQPYHALASIENEDLKKIWDQHGLSEDLSDALEQGLLHFPISVFLEIPLIGTAFSALGKDLSKQLTKLALQSKRHLTLEFHSVDLLALKEDNLDPSLDKQNDLKWSLSRKIECARTVLETIHKRSTVVRLDEIARKAYDLI